MLKPHHHFRLITGTVSIGILLAVLAQGAKAESLTFNADIGGKDIGIPFPSDDSHLGKACDGERKCICVNDAIFRHDSSWATKGIGRKASNPCNMRPPKLWKPSVPFTVYKSPGNGEFAKFGSLEDGITACVELYKRSYADLDAKTLVKRWAQTSNKNYHDAVASCF